METINGRYATLTWRETIVVFWRNNWLLIICTILALLAFIAAAISANYSWKTYKEKTRAMETQRTQVVLPQQTRTGPAAAVPAKGVPTLPAAGFEPRY